MVKYFILLSMIFLHIIADFNLQGSLTSYKQKKWWEENAPQRLYKYDYLVALIVHSFSWTFMIMLPIAIDMNFAIDNSFLFLFASNVACHAIVDNEKANNLTINLVMDQTIHIMQIILTFMYIT